MINKHKKKCDLKYENSIFSRAHLYDFLFQKKERLSLSLTHVVVEKVLFLDQISDLHIMRSSESENHIFSFIFLVCVCMCK